MSSRSSSGRGLVAVTGCSSGIGEATVHALVASGYRVLAGVRKLEDAAGFASHGDQVEPIIIDVTNADQIAAFKTRIDAEPGGLAGLVNNAGIIGVGPVELIPEQRWREIMEVNVFGTINVTKASIPAVLKAKGAIVNVSSPSGRIALPMLGPYSTSKFAMEALSDTLRRELAHVGVRVVCVSPGFVSTPIFDKGVGEGQAIIDAQYNDPDLYERYAALAFSAVDAGRDAKEKGGSPDKAAGLIVRAVSSKRPPARLYGGIENRAVNVITKWIPTPLLDVIIGKISRTEPR